MVDLLVGEQTWAYARVFEGRAAVIALNTGETEATIDAAAEPALLPEGVVMDDRLGSPAKATVSGGRLRLTLAAGSSALFLAP